LEGVLRQDLNYIDFADGGSDYRGSTALGVDFHLPLQNWQPFLGALVGFAYGDGIRDTWFASPEVGLKYFVNPTTFIQGLVQYQWFWRSTSDFDTNFDDGRFVYGLGIGFRF
ncbi:MAG: hypothetical protein IH614_07475, partial [Desulfuromonadales bacterium]|nr:hypothetical protein [Desulfuromonadales bacterium]